MDRHLEKVHRYRERVLGCCNLVSGKNKIVSAEGSKGKDTWAKHLVSLSSPGHQSQPETSKQLSNTLNL